MFPEEGGEKTLSLVRGSTSSHGGKLRNTARCLEAFNMLLHCAVLSFNFCRDPVRTVLVSPQETSISRERRLPIAPSSSSVNMANDSYWAGVWHGQGVCQLG